jgi:ribosomal subunit interface protein
MRQEEVVVQVQIAGRKIDVGAALQERIAAGLEDRISKYFQRTGEAVVAVSKPGWAFHVDCSIHLPSGVALQAHGEADDAYAAFEVALDKIEKRVRRYKRRLKDHHRPKVALPAEAASERVIQATTMDELEDDQEGEDGLNGFDHGDAPIIVAEADMHLRTMSVSMAVMQLELGDSPALMFRNASHGALNMVYRRPDGNIGWVDPGQDA